MVIAIFVFAFFGRPAWYWLIVTRILLLPVIAGLAYELIRFAGKHADQRWILWLLAPGLWLQRLTTRQPTLDQLEVSIRALERGAGEGRSGGRPWTTSGGDGVMCRADSKRDLAGRSDGRRGRIESVGSGAISGLDVTWASRSEPAESGRTSPEELIAAAHAACFSMALSHGLAQAGNAARAAEREATSTFVPGTGITTMKLDVTGRVPGLDEAAFQGPPRARARTAPSRRRSRATSTSPSTRTSRASRSPAPCRGRRSAGGPW